MLFWSVDKKKLYAKHAKTWHLSIFVSTHITLPRSRNVSNFVSCMNFSRHVLGELKSVRLLLNYCSNECNPHPLLQSCTRRINWCWPSEWSSRDPLTHSASSEFNVFNQEYYLVQKSPTHDSRVATICLNPVGFALTVRRIDKSHLTLCLWDVGFCEFTTLLMAD